MTWMMSYQKRYVNVFHWCLTFSYLFSSPNSCWPGRPPKYHLSHQGLERCVSPCILALISVFVWGVQKSGGIFDGNLMGNTQGFLLGICISWYLWFVFVVHLKSPRFQVHTATPVNLRRKNEMWQSWLGTEFWCWKMWQPKKQRRGEHFLELGSIYITFTVHQYFIVVVIKKMWKIFPWKSPDLRVSGWLCFWVFRLSRETAPLFIFHRPNKSRHEDCNHPPFGIGICQRAHQGERTGKILYYELWAYDRSVFVVVSGFFWSLLDMSLLCLTTTCCWGDLGRSRER